MSIGNLGNVGSADNVGNWGTIGNVGNVRKIDSNPQRRFKLTAVAALLPPGNPSTANLASLAGISSPAGTPLPWLRPKVQVAISSSDTQCMLMHSRFCTHRSLQAPPPHLSSEQILSPCASVVYVPPLVKTFMFSYPPQAVRAFMALETYFYFFHLIFHYNYGVFFFFN